MASGIALNKSCDDSYSALSKRDHASIFLKITKEPAEIALDRTFPPLKGDPEAEWKEQISLLPSDDCRYIITDFSWKDTPTVVSSKIILILWSPDTAPIRSKMMYASSMEAVTASMAVQKTIQANDKDEVEYHVIKDSVHK